MNTNFLKTSFAVAALLGMSFSMEAQSNRPVKLMIDHSANGNTFVPLNSFELWDGNIASLENLFYYIHDVFIVTGQGDTLGTQGDHFLVDGEQVAYDLGTFTADSAQRVFFKWGVSMDMNHADPAQYDMGHPLAPKNPTMHWGWASGYRFLRADGKVDEDGDAVPERSFQYHMVGNQFVGDVLTEATSLINDNGELEVWITAHYERLFNDFAILDQAVTHGSDFPVPLIYSNALTAAVFTDFDGRVEAPDSNVGFNTLANEASFRFSSNPAHAENIFVVFDDGAKASGLLEVYGINGALNYQADFVADTRELQLPTLPSGAYMIRVIDEAHANAQMRKLIVQ